MVEDLGVEMKLVLLGDIVEAGQILPIDLAVIDFLSAGPFGPTGTGIEKAYFGIPVQFAYDVEPSGLDALQPFLVGQLPMNGDVLLGRCRRVRSCKDAPDSYR